MFTECTAPFHSCSFVLFCLVSFLCLSCLFARSFLRTESPGLARQKFRSPTPVQVSPLWNIFKCLLVSLVFPFVAEAQVEAIGATSNWADSCISEATSLSSISPFNPHVASFGFGPFGFGYLFVRFRIWSLSSHYAMEAKLRMDSNKKAALDLVTRCCKNARFWRHLTSRPAVAKWVKKSMVAEVTVQTAPFFLRDLFQPSPKWTLEINTWHNYG